MRNTPISVRLVVFSKFYHFLLIPFLALLFDQINVLNNPERSAILTIQKRGVYHYLKYFFEQLYFFEIITFAILALLINRYNRWLKLDQVNTGLRSLVMYELKWLPLFLLSIFVFGPVTNFFRYMVLLYPSSGWKYYFPEFFMSFSMYFNYLVPIVIWGYVVVNTNLIVSYLESREEKNDRAVSRVLREEGGGLDIIIEEQMILEEGIVSKDELQTVSGNKVHELSGNNVHELSVNKVYELSVPKTENYLKVIEGTTVKGISMLVIADIFWFEVQNKNYYAHLSVEAYLVKRTISELEKELNPDDFFRINRSQIINLHQIQSYSYWEFEKYIVRLTGIDQKEFIITRKRFKELKEQIEKIKSV